MAGRQGPEEQKHQEPYDFYKPVEQEPITLRGEWKKLRKMGFRDGVEYLWNNYTAQVIVIFLLIVLVAIIGSSIYQRTRPRPYLTLGLIDYDGYSEYLEGEDIAAEDGSTEHLTINTFQGLSAETIASGEGQDTVMGITAMVAAGDLDGIIASGESILLLQRNSGDYFYDLEEQFGENELAMLQDRLLYAQDEDGVEYPVAVNISGLSALKGAGETPENMYVAFTYNTRNARHLRQWIFQELGYRLTD